MAAAGRASLGCRPAADAIAAARRRRVALPERTALLALGAATLLTAGGTLLVRLSDVGPTATAGYRMALAGLAAGLLTAGRPVPERTARGHAPAWALLAGLALAADLAVWHRALLWTTIANASLLGNLAPVFLAGAGWLGLGQRPTPRFAAGLGIVLSGTAALGGASVRIDGRHLAGDGLAVLGAAFYAVYLAAVKRAGLAWSPARVMRVGGLAGGIALLGVTLLVGERLAPATGGGWLVLVTIGLVAAGAQVLLLTALSRLPLALTALSGLLQPVVAAVLAWGLLGETLGPRQLLAGAMILGGLLVARHGSR